MNNKRYKKTSAMIGVLASVMLIASPFAAFAKTTANDNNRGNAFGHEIASGWNRLFGATVLAATTTTPNRAPTINGVSSPTVLNVGATGNWTVSASDPENGALSYSVDWGDQNTFLRAMAFLGQPTFVQTASFSHAYSAPGTYTVRFTVKDSAGLMTHSSVTVHVAANPNALAITGVSATANGSRSAHVAWTTNVRADTEVWYSTASPVDISKAPAVRQNDRTLNHQVTLNRLTPGTTYFVVVGSVDAYGNTVTAPETSFITPALPSAGPTISSFTGPANIAALAQGTWTVNASDPRNSPISYSIDWGDAPQIMALFATRAPVFQQTSTFDHIYSDSGTYTITVTAENGNGLTTTATTSVTVTPAATTTPVTGPTLSSVNIGLISSSTVDLSWRTDINADSEIYYSTASPVLGGTTSARSVIDATATTGHLLRVSGLAPSTAYSFVVRSVDANGNASASDEIRLTTAGM